MVAMTHEHEWTPRGRYGRGCPCGVEEFEFSALDATAKVQARRLHETLSLPDTLVVRFDKSPRK